MMLSCYSLPLPSHRSQGSSITRMMGRKYPSACKASHLNLVPAGPPAFTAHPFLAIETAIRYMTSMFSPQERRGLERTQDFQKNGMGYFHMQSSKPQTLGYALADSPVALLAWMYEKLHDWTDAYPWTEDEILTWVSLYYFSAAGPAASVRLYYEAVHTKTHNMMTPETWVPNVKLVWYPSSKCLPSMPANLAYRAWLTSPKSFSDCLPDGDIPLGPWCM